MESFQEQVLKYIIDYYEIKGHAPSVDMILIEVGAASIIEVTACLAELEKLGYIRQNQSGISLLKNSTQAKIIVDTDRKLRVFLCHASQDKPVVRDLYQRLLAEGWIAPWLDEEDLLPGQEWASEIPLVVREVDVVIVCISKKSVTKEGYVQKEISYALDIADEKPEGTIYIIPVLLEECQVPGRLRRWQWLDFNKEKSYDKLLMSLRHRAEKNKSNFLSVDVFQSIPSFEHIMTTYVLGDDLYEEIFDINSLSGEVLGTFGVTFAETLGNGIPKKAIALQTWIWDTGESSTNKKIFLSTRAYYDPVVRKRLEIEGEVILIEPRKQVLLTTKNLQLLVTVADFEYIKDYPSSACFERATFELIVYPKI